MIPFLQKIYAELIHSSYLKNIFILSSGVGFAQLIPLILLPVLTRFFGPTDFGILAIFMAMIQLIAISSTFRLEMAVILPDKDIDAAILCLRAFCYLSLIVLFILAFLYFLFPLKESFPSSFDILFSNFSWFNHETGFLSENSRVIYLIPVGAFFLGMYNILYSWNNRMEFYKNMSYSHITHSLVSTPFAILCYFSVFKSIALILGQVFARFLACFLLLKNLYRTLQGIPLIHIVRQSHILAKEYRKFMIYETPHAIVNFFSQKMIIGFFSVFFGFFAVGVFDLADKIIGKPLGIISNSLKTVFYKRLTTAKDKITIFKKSLVLMTFVSCSLIAPVYIIPNHFFVFLLGPEWIDIGLYIQLICPLLLSRFIFNVVSPTISFTLQNHYLLIWQIIYFIGLGILFLVIHELTIEKVLLLYALFGAYMYMILGYISFLVLKKHIKY